MTAELKSSAWQSALGDRHLSWQVIANTNRWNQYNNGLSTSWNNYANIDAIVAVRSFDPRHRWLTGMFSGGFKSKPATKLYNAWLAGAIPILGVESAYRETGQRGQDYMEVKSFKGLLNCLDRLKSDVDWRRSLLEQGQQRAQGFTADKIVRKWQVFIEAVAIPTYAEWCDYSPRQRQQALIFSRLANYRDRLARRGQRIFNV
ncbi:MAG: hypothetical protein HC800_09535 [Phormidesmis sp. RL_2_1]|nr:hypothetical protein [Phormidesmis sp. RL_2_1]